jgi:hypothetical protein
MINASLFYSKSKVFEDQESRIPDYYINPVTDPYCCFVRNLSANITWHGNFNIYLPSARQYDGIELSFFTIPFITLSVSGICVYPISNDKLYVLDGVFFKEKSYVGPGGDMVTIKSIGGSWFVIRGTPVEMPQ